jgi:hypothetical protein
LPKRRPVLTPIISVAMPMVKAIKKKPIYARKNFN